MKSRPLDAKVVALTHYLPPYMARVLFYASQQVRELKILLSIAEEPNRQFGNTWDGLDVTVQKSLMFKRPWKHQAGFQDELFVHLPYDTVSQLRRQRPDIVFSYELGFRSLISAVYCKTHGKKLALCVCVSEHTEQGRGFLRYRLRRMLLRAADAVTYNGPSCLRYLKSFGVRDDRLFHFPYCQSDLSLHTGSIERSSSVRRKLVCVGQLTERKGVLPMLKHLISFCATRPEQTIELDIVGTGSLREQLQSLELPRNLCVRFLGHLNHLQLREALLDAGVLIFPTLADEWGLVVNEAMQAGLPVIGSKFAQASTTLIQDDHNGWQYNPADARSLHQHLDRMLAASDEELNQLGQNAQQTVAEITSPKVATQAVEMFRYLSRTPDDSKPHS